MQPSPSLRTLSCPLGKARTEHAPRCAFRLGKWYRKHCQAAERLGPEHTQCRLTWATHQVNSCQVHMRRSSHLLTNTAQHCRGRKLEPQVVASVRAAISSALPLHPHPLASLPVPCCVCSDEARNAVSVSHMIVTSCKRTRRIAVAVPLRSEDSAQRPYARTSLAGCA